MGLFHKQLPHSKSKPFPREPDHLSNPYSRTVLPQISKALGHERVQFTLVGLCPGVTIAANFSRADPGAKRRKKGLLQKQLPSSKPKPFPKESDRLSNPCSRTVSPQISKALGHERVQFTLVGLRSGFTIAANFSRADPGFKRRKVGLFHKQLPHSKPKPFPKEPDRLLNPY